MRRVKDFKLRICPKCRNNTFNIDEFKDTCVYYDVIMEDGSHKSLYNTRTVYRCLACGELIVEENEHFGPQKIHVPNSENNYL